MTDPSPPKQHDRWSRRHLLSVAGASTVAAAGVATLQATRRGGAARSSDDVVPFHGVHQAGITTAAQDRLHFAAFDVTTQRRAELIDLLQAWTDAAATMMRGLPLGTYGATGGPYLAPPDDTGEALGLSPARLTITVGLGPSLFVDDGGHDRFGLAARQPRSLRDLPHFPGDDLDSTRCGGDLCVQACADDPQVAVHAVRNMARIAFGAAALRWSQLGFGRTSSTSTAQVTPRNLMGFKDGTANLKREDAGLLDRFVWVAGGDDAAADWLAAGTYLVARRISMHIETWDRTSLAEQEGVIGRDKHAGAPLSGGDEFTEIDFESAGTDGPLVPVDAHVRLAHPDGNGGSRMLRRGYNFTDGSDGLGRLDAGLFFIAFTRDPFEHFVPVQNNLARHDALNEYIRHTGSAVFAVPAGVTAGSNAFLGGALF